MSNNLTPEDEDKRFRLSEWLPKENPNNLTREIPLTQGQVALVDESDYDLLNQWKWCVKKDRNTYYAMRGVERNGKSKSIMMHRLILGLKKNDSTQADHVDGNGLNNRRSNLRVCTNQQNQFNQRHQIGKSSKYKGVCWNKKDKIWTAQIRKDQKSYHLGSFRNERDGALAYNKKAKEFFGEYAQINTLQALSEWEDK